MLSIAALVPSPPVLVPELSGRPVAATEADADDPLVSLRAAVLAAGERLAGAATRWTVLGAGPEAASLGPEASGTFRGFGADVRVSLGGAAGPPDPLLPLPALIAGWLRARVAPAASADARIVAATTAAEGCAEVGATLRAELDADPAPHGVLVVADGAATLAKNSPGYFDDRAEAHQDELDRALSAGDRAGLRALDPGLCAELALAGRPAYQALGGLFTTDPADPSVETLYRAAPFGVGYHVSVWRPTREAR